MGVIRVILEGSFTPTSREEHTFYAKDHGHAHAATEALQYLASVVQASTNNDHACRDDNEFPASGFNKPIKPPKTGPE